MKSLFPRGLLRATRMSQRRTLSEAAVLLQRFMKQSAKGSPAKPAAAPLRPAAMPPMARPQAKARPEPSIPKGARYLSVAFANEAGSRPYKLYVPSGYRAGRPVPLIVMLHGCTQSPDDFAIGTRMHEAAERQTFLVAFPGQTGAANPHKCWNWFNTGDQRRDKGEPAIIAGITREIMRDYAVDPQRVYVAGLSAGGAAAAIMAETYPELYAAIGVHSGLACGAAHDVASAFAVMKNGGAGIRHHAGERSRVVPAIVFHGDRDPTVNARNGEDVVVQAMQGTAMPSRIEPGHSADGRAFSRTVHLGADKQPVIEQWVVHGGGHAWFGGDPAGSFADPNGPDATKEMVRFFLEHPLTGRH